ncbi:MAG: EMC3/TMCO1 family protein [Candidatus ainarchaeum sp.]|nr:EMC3/TMCO1 family protein [Candidatus ainarchaeum sp.]
MDGTLFLITATVLALLYAFAIRFIQSRLIDQDKMKAIQKRFNQINKDYMDAMRSGNKKKIDQLQAEQDKIMPEFNKLMGGQMRMMIVVIIIFVSFMAVVNFLDPYSHDDRPFAMEYSESSGQWCGSYQIDCSMPGPHGVSVTANFRNEGGIISVIWNKLTGQEAGTRTVAISCGQPEGAIPPHLSMSGVPINITTDKNIYSQSDTVLVCATAPGAAYNATGKTDSGTWFMVPLPFAIPVLETQAIVYGAAPWFVLVSLIAGVIFSFAIGKLKGVKNDKKKG